jgi:hypothetical protein
MLLFGYGAMAFVIIIKERHVVIKAGSKDFSILGA